MNVRNLRTSAEMSACAVVISSGLVKRPRPTRMLECESLSERPMAFSTCDGVTAAVVQAEPEETASSDLRAIIRASLCTPGKVMFKFPGSRCLTLPLTLAFGMALSRDCRS